MKMSFFKEAREIIRNQPAGPKVDMLRVRTDECQEAFDLFVIERTTESLHRLVACWTRMHIAISVMPPVVVPTPPSAGREPATALAA